MMFRSLTICMLCTLIWPAQAGFWSKDNAASGQAEQDFPTVEDAFQLEAATWDGKTLKIGWRIAEDCYLYRDRIHIKILEPAGLDVSFQGSGPVDEIEDPHFGKSAVFRQIAEMRYETAQRGAPRTLEVRYQGCAEDKVCYPPQTRKLVVLQQPGP